MDEGYFEACGVGVALSEWAARDRAARRALALVSDEAPGRFPSNVNPDSWEWRKTRVSPVVVTK